jgi:hypothetical protein
MDGNYSIETHGEGHYRIELFLGESSYGFVAQTKALYDILVSCFLS